MHYVVGGLMQSTVSGDELLIRPGQFYIMPPNVYHEHRGLGENTQYGFSMRWGTSKESPGRFEAADPPQLENILPFYESLTYSKTVPISDNGIVYGRLIDMLESAAEKSTVIELQLMFVNILMYISHFYDKNSALNEQVNERSIQAQIVETAKNFIEENYFCKINVEEIADFVHLSYGYLARLFKFYEGRGINECLTETRNRKAKFLLHSTDYSIEKIADETGFANESYFCIIFKKLNGITPKKYREQAGRLDE